MQLARRRYVPAAICAAALAGAALPAPAPAQSSPAAAPAARQVAAPVPKLAWKSCGTQPELERFLCATAQVPTDYDRPNGAKTQIALTKLPASGDPAQRLGTLFTNPGGPGGSGVEFVQDAAALWRSPIASLVFSAC